MSRYDSALEWMRVRAMNEHKDVGDFWRVWGASADKHFKHTEGTVDYKQYKAENELFKIIWPRNFFPGKNPHRKYTSQLHQMQTRGLRDGMSFETFAATWNTITRHRTNNDDDAHYSAEKELWDTLWGWTGQSFPGINPSDTNGPYLLPAPTAPAAPTISSAPISRSQNGDLYARLRLNRSNPSDLPSVAWPSTHPLSAPTQMKASQPSKEADYHKSSPEEIVEKYNGEGIEFDIGGKTTRRTLDYGMPEKLKEESAKKELSFKDIPPKVTGRRKKRKIDEAEL